MAILLQRRGAGDAGAFAQQEGVADDLGLLLDPVAGKGLAGLQRIVVTAEGMAPERQVDALLPLPDMDEFVDQQPLRR